MTSRCLILAGIGNSGPQHWQSRWQAEDPTIERLEHSEWNTPDCDVWVRELEEALSRRAGDTVLVAHSLACLVVACWAATSKQSVAGALLVSVPDPAGPNFPAEASNFQRVSQRRLPFPSVVVSSSDDPYGTSEYMRGCASAWGGRFHSVGPLGHINASSGLGGWAEGKSFLHELCA